MLTRWGIGLRRCAHGGLVGLSLGCLVLTGCGRKAPPQVLPPIRIVETVEVKVPVPVRVPPPAELLALVRPPLPAFVIPTDPGASSALTVEGERLLRALIEDLLTRIAAWEAWAKSE